MSEPRAIRLKVNGISHEASIEPRMTLADFIRDELGLTGTHLGCEHGVCGACTVLIGGRSVRSCLTFAVQADGLEIQTVEGLLEPDGSLHVLQEEFASSHALQCGFCTPGILMTMVEYLAEERDPEEERIRDRLGGNLCRCTGYQNIIKAVMAASARMTARD
jgi:aerobic-type carbon monoxide dehydrogenase small subunit (CoxS/CutS family)